MKFLLPKTSEAKCGIYPIWSDDISHENILKHRVSAILEDLRGTSINKRIQGER